MSDLAWKSYGDHGRTARGDLGTWRIVTDGIAWHLSIQPNWTRGMLHKGKFAGRQLAMDHAQDCENDDPPIEPDYIVPSNEVVS